MAGGDDHVTSLRLTEGMLPDGALRVDLGDEITGAMCVTHDGEVRKR